MVSQTNRAKSVPLGINQMYPVPIPKGRSFNVQFDARQLADQQYIDEGYGEEPDGYIPSMADYQAAHHGKLPIFAPKMEISAAEILEMEERLPEHLRRKLYPRGLEPLDLARTYSLESEGTDLTSPGNKKSK